MRIIILGGDGYLGWPTAMHFARRGHQVAIVDNLSKRAWEAEMGVTPLFHIPTLQRRVRLWNNSGEKPIKLYVGDIAANHRFVYTIFRAFHPDAIVHYAEQPSAPYSMHSRLNAVHTQVNNISGTLNVVFAMKRHCPDAHLVKLGTMGEYGTPNIDIEEGWIELEHNGRKDRMLYPKRPGSFYHLSKVHDSHNIEFACRIWGMRATDLNQGIVYGIETEETDFHPEFLTSFHYDEVFGTVLNRFATQAVAGIPLTVYGKGGQSRGFLNIRDTIKCIEIAVSNPAKVGEFRVFNQFTEMFSIIDLAKKVKEVGESLRIKVSVEHTDNPRVESEEHYFNAKNTSLIDLGLMPHLLTEQVIERMMKKIMVAREHIDRDIVHPHIRWTFQRGKVPMQMNQPKPPATGQRVLGVLQQTPLVPPSTRKQ
ncbi:MAG: NAD-dependent epimerase/dehydratase family protein [Candidatus Vogelbacteria bacterium]|nr:NAD-dependent epimerase/dehydratase family protein [Candidatus Vogelbacteria bacterium]